MEIYAHRGFSSKAPENTMVSFKKAIDLNISGIELDIQMTKDKKIVVIHDEKLKRTTNGKGLIKEKKYEELKRLNAGSWFNEKYSEEKIPLLSEVLKLLKNTKLKINIELKNDKIRYNGMEEGLLELLDRHSIIDKVIISSFNYESLKLMYKLNSDIEISFLTKKINKSLFSKLKKINAKGVHTKLSKLNKRRVKKLHEENIKIRCYTINKKRHLKKAIKYNVDGIFTDNPGYILNMKGDINE